MKTKNKLNCIEFDRIKGGKPFDTNQDWYIKMMKEIKEIENKSLLQLLPISIFSDTISEKLKKGIEKYN